MKSSNNVSGDEEENYEEDFDIIPPSVAAMDISVQVQKPVSNSTSTSGKNNLKSATELDGDHISTLPSIVNSASVQSNMPKNDFKKLKYLNCSYNTLKNVAKTKTTMELDS